jgi:cadmium resistance protein CadD (predicted permease)
MLEVTLDSNEKIRTRKVLHSIYTYDNAIAGEDYTILDESELSYKIRGEDGGLFWVNKVNVSEGPDDIGDFILRRYITYGDNYIHDSSFAEIEILAEMSTQGEEKEQSVYLGRVTRVAGSMHEANLGKFILATHVQGQKGIIAIVLGGFHGDNYQSTLVAIQKMAETASKLVNAMPCVTVTPITLN